ncbi:uncharacterized protein AMSG_11930 [Thecamonas trahens ATCC 50062]|uniref:PAS domain-containing protein n=1 Tax=Thecamonas trahens ATCC 50062 TaxID=461836 RepID=A0A0L0DCB3_THETB|nr:hypothetical protein AMSG_11930 [Thecamonas trahens ATCC 50062]KNC49726.1 hypothetical protein AMSG_11930 [Thecamonas trahens ATCC 50062]|eukprot:XP_013757610.1 hypothetical protein AMSG_11930 [Thecamonas trahens ATCC 50062]
MFCATTRDAFLRIPLFSLSPLAQTAGTSAVLAQSHIAEAIAAPGHVTRFEWEFTRLDSGTLVTEVALTAMPEKVKGRTLLQVSITDVSSTGTMQDRNSKLAVLLATMSDGVIMVGDDGMIMDLNPSALMMLNLYNINDVINTPFLSLLDMRATRAFNDRKVSVNTSGGATTGGGGGGELLRSPPSGKSLNLSAASMVSHDVSEAQEEVEEVTPCSDLRSAASISEQLETVELNERSSSSSPSPSSSLVVDSDNTDTSSPSTVVRSHQRSASQRRPLRRKMSNTSNTSRRKDSLGADPRLDDKRQRVKPLKLNASASAAREPVSVSPRAVSGRRSSSRKGRRTPSRTLGPRPATGVAQTERSDACARSYGSLLAAIEKSGSAQSLISPSSAQPSPRSLTHTKRGPFSSNRRKASLSPALAASMTSLAAGATSPSGVLSDGSVAGGGEMRPGDDVVSLGFSARSGVPSEASFDSTMSGAMSPAKSPRSPADALREGEGRRFLKVFRSVMGQTVTPIKVEMSMSEVHLSTSQHKRVFTVVFRDLRFEEQLANQEDMYRWLTAHLAEQPPGIVVFDVITHSIGEFNSSASVLLRLSPKRALERTIIELFADDDGQTLVQSILASNGEDVHCDLLAIAEDESLVPVNVDVKHVVLDAGHIAIAYLTPRQVGKRSSRKR